MSALSIGFIALALAMLLIAFRIQIGIALGLVSFCGIAAILDMRAAFGTLTAVPFNFVGDWNLSAIPMFLLMGFVASESGLTAGLFSAMRMVLWRLPGGLAIASVAACALFAAASGSSVATASAMSRIATPEMLKHKYDPGLASGVIAASGTLGSLIPPSILMILYGYYAEVSIGKLFAAGIVPGLVSAGLYVTMIVARVGFNPTLAPQVEVVASPRERIAAVREVWPLVLLVCGVLVGIFMGVFTPTEAGAVGACLAFLLAGIQRRLSFENTKRAIFQTLSSTASIFLVVIGTVLLTRLMALSGVPGYLAEQLFAFGESELFILVVVSLVYIILGMFLDSIGLLLLTLPVVLPVATSADINLIWFGIIVVKLLEIGLMTPPLGLNIFIMKGALGTAVSLDVMFRGVGWFVITDIGALAIIITFPELSLFLPEIMN